MRKLLALAFTLWSGVALAQNVPNHAMPIGRGTGVSGFGIGGPCAAGQSLIWVGGPTVDPTCASAASAGLTVGVSSIAGGVTQQVLFDSAGVLGEITKQNSSILATNGSGVPSWVTSLPDFSVGTLTLTTALAGANKVPLTTLAQVATKSVLGNKTAGLANVTAAWTVPNTTDTVIPLVTGALVTNNAACLADTLGTIKDCGVLLGTAAAAATGTSAHTIPFLDGANTWSATQTHSADVIFNSTFHIGAVAFTWPAGVGNADVVLGANTIDQTVAGGANLTPYNPAAGNYTADCGRNPAQWIAANTIAWTITAPTNDGECILQVEIGTTGVVPAFSGFSQGSSSGDTMSVPVAGTNYYQISITRIHTKSHYLVSAMQP